MRTRRLVTQEKKAQIAVKLVEKLTKGKLSESEVEDLATVLMGLTERSLRDALKTLPLRFSP